jgi:hypothetical protein
MSHLPPRTLSPGVLVSRRRQALSEPVPRNATRPQLATMSTWTVHVVLRLARRIAFTACNFCAHTPVGHPCHFASNTSLALDHWTMIAFASRFLLLSTSSHAAECSEIRCVSSANYIFQPGLCSSERTRLLQGSRRGLAHASLLPCLLGHTPTH